MGVKTPVLDVFMAVTFDMAVFLAVVSPFWQTYKRIFNGWENNNISLKE